MISADFFSAISLTLPSNLLVRVWISSLQVSTSSSVRIFSVCSMSACLLASRRMLRIDDSGFLGEILDAAASFLRCSTESGGDVQAHHLAVGVGR